jgi:hypothetical protein
MCLLLNKACLETSGVGDGPVRGESPNFEISLSVFDLGFFNHGQSFSRA